MTQKDNQNDRAFMKFKTPLIDVEGHDRAGVRRGHLLMLMHVFGALICIASLPVQLVYIVFSIDGYFALEMLSFGMMLFGSSILLSFLHKWASGPTETKD